MDIDKSAIPVLIFSREEDAAFDDDICESTLRFVPTWGGGGGGREVRLEEELVCLGGGGFTIATADIPRCEQYLSNIIFVIYNNYK